ncbi:MAG: VOC family protein [Gammaproteobacteria bacterium]|nr:VOC family protein [Gammaproteobacteria bacterium]
MKPAIAVSGQCGLVGTKFMIIVQEMDRAIAFYRDVIGLEVKLHTDHWSELAFGDATVALHGGGDTDFRATGLSFTVSDIDKACHAVIDGGGSIRSQPEDRGDEGIHLAMLTDTENNGFMFSQPK